MTKARNVVIEAISKYVEIDMGHRIPQHQSVCRRVHGHRYKIELFGYNDTLQTSGSSEGMIVDYGVLKALLMQYVHSVFDHRFAAWYGDQILGKDYSRSYIYFLNNPYRYQIVNDPHFGEICILGDIPTAENLAVLWLSLCVQGLEEYRALPNQEYSIPDSFRLTSIKVWETPSSCVSAYVVSEPKQ